MRGSHHEPTCLPFLRERLLRFSAPWSLLESDRFRSELSPVLYLILFITRGQVCVYVRCGVGLHPRLHLHLRVHLCMQASTWHMAYGGNFWDSVLFPPWDPEIKLPSSVLGDVLKSLLPTVCLSGPEGVCLFVCFTREHIMLCASCCVTSRGRDAKLTLSVKLMLSVNVTHIPPLNISLSACH